MDSLSRAQGAAVDAMNNLDTLQRLLDEMGNSEAARDVRILAQRVREINRLLGHLLSAMK